jgi:predicted hydrocarbon binding protein
MRGLMLGSVVLAFNDYAAAKCTAGAAQVVRTKLAGINVMATTDYEDGIVLEVIGAVALHEKKSVSAVLEEFGRHFIAWAEPRFRMAFAVDSAKEFLLGICRLHQTVVSTLPKSLQSGPPDFKYESPADDKLIMVYNSPRQLCSLMVGLIQGVADRFGESVAIQQTECMLRGDKLCRFELQFRPRE